MKLKSLSDLDSVNSYLKRIGAEPRSLRTAVVREMRGSYWTDIATIRFDRDGKVHASEGYEPTEQELKGIELECQRADWPNIKKLTTPPDWHQDILDADPENLFYFRDEQGLLCMVQVRKENRDGDKIYVPYTYWDDGEWRKAEPDGALPLWGVEYIGQNTTVFIHEGAKAARAVQRMVSKKTAENKRLLAEHPWGQELQGAAHVGWIGGALSPSRTDWSVLHRLGIKRAYIVSDNDAPGRSAVPRISQELRMVTFHVQFTSEWPVAFDLADKFPDDMFSVLDGVKRYIGPKFSQCLHPATWMTDLIPVPKGRPVAVIREHAREIWAYVQEPELFVCTIMPSIVHTVDGLSKVLSSFSHSSNTSNLLLKAYRGRITKLCYRPDVEGIILTDSTTSAINLHTPTHIKSEPGDVTIFTDFLHYLFPAQEERKQVERWCATLIARPEIRMAYGLLLVSESQGIGKTTLGSHILAPLVGIQNCGWPTEKSIVDSAFNPWCGHKRLVIVNEIYSGHSWKAYNSLKSIITDSEIEINQKFQKPYMIENWAHVIAMSNSLRALKMEEDDRRWFYPEVTEVPWPIERFKALRDWTGHGGLSVIKFWAENYGDYVKAGERAPATSRKKELIEGSRSEAQREASQIAVALAEETSPCCISMQAIILSIRSSSQSTVHDSDYELRKTMRDSGAHQHPARVKINSRLQYVMINGAMKDLLARAQEEQHASIIRANLKVPNDIMEGAI